MERIPGTEKDDVAGNRAALLAVISGKIVVGLQLILTAAAIPVMLQTFDLDLRGFAWFVLAYLVSRYALMISIGYLGDRIGRKKVYVWGLATFMTGLAIAAFSPNISALYAAGCLMGFGAGTIRAIFPALIVANSPPEKIGKEFGAANMLVAITMLAGPFLGGLIVVYVGWRYVFVLSFFLCVASILACVRYVTESRGGKKRPADGKGILLMFATLVPMAVGLQLTSHSGWASPAVLMSITLALGAGWLFQRHSRAIAFPVIDLSLLKKPRFGLANATYLFQSAGVEVFFLVAPLFLQGYMGLLPDRAGLLLCVAGASCMLVTYLSGLAVDRLGALPMEALGLVLIAVAFGLVAFVQANISLPLVLTAMVMIGLGMGFFNPANIYEVMKCSPETDLGLAGGINETASELGRILVIPLTEIAMGEWAKTKLVTGGIQMTANPMLLEAVDNAYLVALGATVLGLVICALRIRYVRRDTAVLAGGPVPPV